MVLGTHCHARICTWLTVLYVGWVDSAYSSTWLLFFDRSGRVDSAFILNIVK